jgi:predicted DNA-binding protein YlxM (UPF0122 family)
MIAVITGDLINSRKYAPEEYTSLLKMCLGRFGQPSTDWEIYRGDSFQIKCQAKKALQTAFVLKARMMTVKGLNVRMGIGLGEENFIGATIGENNGSAYVHSGQVFEQLTAENNNLAILSTDINYDKTLNLMLKLGLDFMDDWSVASAEMMLEALTEKQITQSEIAHKLGVKQSAVSQGLKRARLSLVHELLEYYEQTLPKN